MRTGNVYDMGSLIGPKGDTGSVGATGATGNTGATGAQGIQGVAGTSYNFADNEKPTGNISGLNTNYTLAHTPTAGTLHVYIAGLRIDTTGFSLSGATMTIATSLVTGLVMCDYKY